ncbi:TetR/AcrR family transcriptional regulator [Streptomyces sp. H34-S4]|uniref:TetR/AcrR family transcriptional regulator n=1 Tax=Streptomyces sp. H34-S4 TaxID=2996463 RepID=UPI00226D45C6|nr:TetR/AcrR family transcriptional regulator [Streptomyces sp. H34-S4]MCY0937132.1 helix-turn-helix domain containing protein [Streptomyces sp. H34-S4]
MNQDPAASASSAAPAPAPAPTSGSGSGSGSGSEPEPDSGLRERKKERTRKLLREGAAALFAEHGFAGTTVADIAACANVSERTFFRYFESKEALLLPDSVDLFAYVEAELARRPPQEDPLNAVCNALISAVAPFAASSLTALTHSVAIAGDERVVAAQLVQLFADFENRLTLLVLNRLPADTPEADLRAGVIAGAALSAVRAVLRTQRRRRANGTLTDTPPSSLLLEAFGMLKQIGSAPQ